MARYWVISSSLACCLIGVISFNITPRDCVIRKNSPKFVYSNVVLVGSGNVLQVYCTARLLLNFSKHSSGLYPPDQLSSARSVFIRWRAEFTTSAPFCTPPVFPAGYCGIVEVAETWNCALATHAGMQAIWGEGGK